MNYAPIALFVYNRPWHTQQAVEALRANVLAPQSPLFVFSDAPRDSAAQQAVEEVRAYIRTIDGFASVKIVERPVNLGLAESIIDGVTRLCDEFQRVIVLEDDLATSRYFLQYMNDALSRYENDDAVMQVAGYLFPTKLDIAEDAMFLPFTSSWGWGTWARAWAHFDKEATAFQRLSEDAELRRAFDVGGRYQYFKMLQSQRKGLTDSWAIRWYLSVFMLKGLVLYPKKTLVRNLGFDGSGVNCVASSIAEQALDESFRVEEMPGTIELTAAYDRILDSIPKPKLNIRTLINRIRKLINAIWHENFN